MAAIAVSGVLIVAGIIGGERHRNTGPLSRRRQLAKPVALRIRGSVAFVANPGGASHTAGTALSTCIPVAMLAA